MEINVVVALIGIINLLFTYGVVRRVKEHEARIAELGSTGAMPPAGPPLESTLPDFSATTTDGRHIDTDMLGSGEAFIGFFDTDCAPCQEQVPRFARLSAARDAGRFCVFIAGDGTRATEMASLFDDHVLVVIEEGPSSTAATLGVNAFPTLLMLSEGVIKANTVSTDQFESLTSVQPMDAR